MTTIANAHPALIDALAKRGYETLTPVQNAVLDPELEGQDLLVSAQTGSGKTVAFGLAFAPTLLGDAERFDRPSSPLALVIAPTRELALQVQRELEWLYGQSGAKVISCVGGMDIRAERRALQQGAHIVVGTPGRLKDHIDKGHFRTDEMRAVVLDEADEMLDMGFRDELESILNETPENRRTLLFSATVPKSILGLAKRYQNNAQRISTKEEKSQHVDIDYQAMSIAPKDRENAIINTLRFHEAQNAIIFCKTRAAVGTMKSQLSAHGFSVVAISGELSQNERSNALQSLRDGRARVCVATDVAARGIDLPGLELVIHADLPQNQDVMLHRSGRTGRAGSKGTSVMIVPNSFRSRADRMLNNAKINATWGTPPTIEEIAKRDQERFLADPILMDGIKEEEKEAAANLLETYGAEQIAAALLRLHNKQKPAPTHLAEVGSFDKRDNQKRHRGDFEKSVWISISVGREDRAEPRWIVPMLCGAGQLTKGDIGSIRIHPNETHAELSAEVAEKFFGLVGEGGILEKDITATRMDHEPEAPKGRIDRSNRPKRNSGGDKKRNFEGKKPYKGRANNDDKPYKGKSKKSEFFSDKSKSQGNKSRDDKPNGEKKAFSDKPRAHRKNDDAPQNKKRNDTRVDKRQGNPDAPQKSNKPKPHRGKSLGDKSRPNKPKAGGKPNTSTSSAPAAKRKTLKIKSNKD